MAKRIRENLKGACLICNKFYGNIAPHVINVHKVNVREYCINYLKLDNKFCQILNCKNEAQTLTKTLGFYKVCEQHNNVQDRRNAKVQVEINKKYNKLTILECIDNRHENGVYVKCLCDCGKNITIELYKVKKGENKSCGCAVEEAQVKYKLLNSLSAYKKLYRHYVNSAIERNLIFELSPEDFIEIVKQDCYYCGHKPSNKIKVNSSLAFYNGIDRVNNSLGYLKINSVSCCTACNYGKRAMTEEEYISHCENVYKNKRLKNADI